jgi:hypothetical protein
VREFATRAEAEAARGDGEVIVEIRSGDGGVRVGIIPATVTVGSPSGQLTQPIADFLIGYWQTVEAEARRRVITSAE